MIRIILLTLLIGGCSFFPVKEPEEVLVYRKQELICDQLTAIKGINPLPVQFQNATNRVGNEVFGLDGENYTNLAINTRETIEFIKSQKAYINYLRGCIDRHNKD